MHKNTVMKHMVEGNEEYGRISPDEFIPIFEEK